MAKRLLACAAASACLLSLALLDRTALFVARLQAATAFVESTSNYVNSAATTNANTLTIAGGNAIGGYCGWPSTTITATVADGTGDTVTARHNPTTNSVMRGFAFYVANASNGSHTLTVTFSSATTSWCVIHEISGVATAPFDQSACNAQFAVGTGTDATTSTAVTTTANGEYIFGASSDWNAGSSLTGGTGFTERETAIGPFLSEDQVQTSAGSLAATFTTDSGVADTVSCVLTFKEPAAANAARRLLLMGVGP